MRPQRPRPAGARRPGAAALLLLGALAGVAILKLAGAIDATVTYGLTGGLLFSLVLLARDLFAAARQEDEREEDLPGAGDARGAPPDRR